MPKSITPIKGWPTGVRAAFTTRGLGCELVQPAVATGRTDFEGLNLGFHVGDEPARVQSHRDALEQAIGAKPIWLNQVHGAALLRVDDTQLSMRQGAAEGPPTGLPAVDALITNQSGQAACIMAADCLPVLAATADGQWVGAAHAGWRGLAAGVLENLMRGLQVAMTEARAAGGPAHPSIMVWLGPCIGPKAFEVGAEVLEAFGLQTSDALVQSSHRPQHFYLDLAGLAARRLQDWAREHGVALDLRTEDQACTWSNPGAFYSHRRAAPCGRMAFLIWREA